MNKAPRLSIVISPSGLEQHIPRLLHSLSRQGPHLWETEVIFSQFASGIDLSETGRQWQEILEGLVVKVENRNSETAAQALNQAFELSEGEFIFHLTPRTRLAPDCIGSFLNLFGDSPETSIAYSDYVRTGAGPFLPGESGLTTLPEFDPVLLRTRNIVGPAAMMRRKVWEDGKEFKANTMYMDWNFWIGAAQNGHEFKRLARPLYTHDGSGQATFRTRAADGGSKAMLVVNNHAFFKGSQVRWALSHLRGEKWATAHRLAEIPDSKDVQAMTNEFVAHARGFSKARFHNALQQSTGPSLAQALLAVLL